MSTFSAALDALKGGAKVNRAGWNGKAMFLVLVPGSKITVTADRPLGEAWPEVVGKEVVYLPHIDMKTVTGEVVPWTSSVTDLLADDWEITARPGYPLKWPR